MDNYRIRVNQANIDHGHIYLREAMSMFPKSVIGGSNKSEMSKQLLSLTYDGLDAVRTDIDGKKLFFRERSAVKEFFKLKNIRANDEVIVTKAGDFEYFVKKA